MSDEVSTTTEVKQTSDGNVKVSLEKYNDLVAKAEAKPPVINRTTVVKTEEMVAEEKRLWGGSLMGLGTSLFAIGATLFKMGRSR